jgi:hypothetical protein
MSDTFDHWEDGAEAEADDFMAEVERERWHKQKQFDKKVALEVKRQLALLLPKVVTPKGQTVSFVKQETKPTHRIGATKTVCCNWCNKPFQARVADINRGWGKFCSKVCKAKRQERRTGQYRRYLEGTL